jgi:hypothetical protein
MVRQLFQRIDYSISPNTEKPFNRVFERREGAMMGWNPGTVINLGISEHPDNWIISDFPDFDCPDYL